MGSGRALALLVVPHTAPTAEHNLKKSGILTLDKDVDPGHEPLVLGGAVEGAAEVPGVVGRGSPEDELAAAQPGDIAAAARVHPGVVLPQLPAHRRGSPASTTQPNHTGFRQNWGFLQANCSQCSYPCHSQINGKGRRVFALPPVRN